MTKMLIAALLALTAAPALAEAPVAATSVVSTADLDLSTTAGQRVLDQRLARAARDVCGKASNADVAGKNDVRRCRTDTLAGLAAERDERIAAASTRPIAVAAR